MKRKTSLMKAAEKYFDHWWKKKDQYGTSHQIALPEAFIAGARWQKRQDIAAVKKLRSFEDWQRLGWETEAIRAIKKGGGV